MIAKLIAEGVMPKGATYAAMEAAMSKGEIAMMISGAWAWSNLKKAKIDFGVAPIPSVDGKPSRAFIGVQGAMINRASANKQLAVEFIENYMLTMDGLKTMDADVSVGVTAHKEFYKSRAGDPLIAATMAERQDRPAHAEQPGDGQVLVGDGVGARQHLAGPPEAEGGARRRGAADLRRPVRRRGG